MPMMWSPGCGCCDPCKATVIDYTPTTPQDRGLAEWQPNTAYTAGDTFYATSNTDGEVYQYEVPSDLTSGTTFDSTEEARYTQQQRADLYDEVSEWYLYGSGWDSLDEDTKHSYLSNGQLGEQMGFLSKSDQLPSTANWNIIFEYDVTDAGENVGAKWTLYSQMTLDGDNEPEDYFYATHEVISSEPVESNATFDASMKTILGKFESPSTNTVFDTTYQASDQGTRQFCRRPEISGGWFAGIADLDDSPTLTTLTGNGIGPDYRYKGIGYTVKNGPGTIPEFAGSPDSLSVDTDDVIVLDGDHTDRTSITEWTVYDGSPAVSLTDILVGGGTNHENPDTAGDFTGLKIGFYVESNGGSDPVITGFNKATKKLNGTPTSNPECPRCSVYTPCPCENTYEYSVWAEIATTTDLTQFESTYWPDDWMHKLGAISSTSVGTTCWLMDTKTTLGDVGRATKRSQLCNFEFVRMHAVRLNSSTDPTGPSTDVERIYFIYQVATLSIEFLPSFQARLLSESTLYCSYLSSNNYTQSSPTLTTLADLQSDGWPDLYFTNGPPVGTPCGKADNITPFEIAYGSVESLVDVETFDCSNFTLQGTYTDDKVFSNTWWNAPNSPPTNPFVSDTWTIQSA